MTLIFFKGTMSNEENVIFNLNLSINVFTGIIEHTKIEF